MSFTHPLHKQKARQAAAEAAVDLVRPHTIVGLGTGDTASYAIQLLAKRNLPGLLCVSTSVRSERLAKELGLQTTTLDRLRDQSPATLDRLIDITIDGADEIDPELRLIKGKGGALLFEKLVAQQSKRVVIVADETKLVQTLGETCTLPVEIVSFGSRCTLRLLQKSSPQAKIRMERTAPYIEGVASSMEGSDPYITDGGNLLVEYPFTLSQGIDANSIHQQIKLLPGVIETGFFLTEATDVLIGTIEGSVMRFSRKRV